jgi:hypothetical protein
MIDHRRDDLVELPCDCEPPAPAHATSPYLNRPLRSLIAAVRDVSATRDLPIWTFELIRPQRDNVISLAVRRLRRAAR